MSADASQIDDGLGRVRPVIASYFGEIASQGGKGPIGELAVLLSAGVLEAAAFEKHVRRHGVAKEEWFKRQLVDLALGFIKEGLRDGALSENHLMDVRALNAFLTIDDGDFFELRPAEVATILGAQLDRILEDAVISNVEELYQVELQAAFGLGYDDYLALTRGAFERTFLDLSLQAGGSGSSALDAERKLEALEPVYRLATARRRTLGARY